MWRVMAGRAAGTSHRRLGPPGGEPACQDAFACEALPEGRIVAAVADGAGSAANSERGAEIAVATTVAEVKRGLAEGRSDFETLLREAVGRAREAVIAEAVDSGAEPGSYASTLLAVVLAETGGAAAQIGDGVIVVRAAPDLTGLPRPDSSPAHDWVYVTWPQHGEYVNTTYFLTREDAAERLEVSGLHATISDFALTTDGLERLVLRFDTQTVHAPFFDAMIRPLVAAADAQAVEGLSNTLASFLASERVASRTDDDVTLVIATRTGANGRASDAGPAGA